MLIPMGMGIASGFHGLIVAKGDRLAGRNQTLCLDMLVFLSWFLECMCFLRVGAWTDIRDFLAQHKVSGVEFSDIEIELHKDRPMSFDIDASETVLSLAQFRTIKKL